LASNKNIQTSDPIENTTSDWKERAETIKEVEKTQVISPL